MKFALITYEYPPVGGGTGKVTKALSKAIVAQGHSVTIVTSRFGDLPRDEMDGDVRVLRIPVLRKYINYARAWEVISFAFSGWAHSGMIQREIAPDYCLGFFTIPCSIVAMLNRIRYGTPFLTFLRGQDVPGFRDTPPILFTLTKPVIKYLWKRSELVVANSVGLANMARQTLPDLDYKILFNSVDSEIYAPAPQTIPDSPFTVLYVGRLRDFKGIHDLVEAFARLKSAASTPVRLRIAGFGPSREELENQVEQLGLKQDVEFLGRLEEGAVAGALQDAHVFVNPSCDEGMPSAVLEAMSSATATVVSDIDPHKEIIVDEEDGLFFPVGDREMLAEHLERLYRDAALRERLAQAARRKILAEFSWARRAAELIDMIEALSVRNA